MKDAQWAHVPFKKRAEEAAKSLSTKFWGLCPAQPTVEPANTDRIVEQEVNINIRLITMEEMFWAIRKLKRRKAAGPDGIPKEIFKEMEEPMLQKVLRSTEHMVARRGHST